MMLSFLYIDPGTGSMLFSLVIGIATTLVFAFRALFVKLRFIFSGGKAQKISDNKIPYVIFSDHKRYWNVFKPICDEFEKRKISLVYYTQSEDDPVFSEKYKFIKSEFIGEGNKGLVKMNMLNAGTVISTTPGLDVLQWKRSKNVDSYVHVPHTIDDLSGYRMFALDHYDVVLCTGQNQVNFVRKIEQLRPAIKPHVTEIVGSTYMDAALQKVKEFDNYKLNMENIKVLVAPSWGRNSILVRFGERLISSLLMAGFKVIVRPHPQSFTADKQILDDLQLKFRDEKNLLWNYDNDNLNALNQSDILITDFSGIILDYSFLMNRPLIYADTKLDTSEYDASWLDEKIWVLRAAEKIGIKLEESQFENIRTVILDALRNVDLEKVRNDVKEECWYNIGHAAESIVNYLVKKGES